MSMAAHLNGDLLKDAKCLTGIDGASEVVGAAPKALVEREAARRLAQMGGTMPDQGHIPRGRSEPA